MEMRHFLPGIRPDIRQQPVSRLDRARLARDMADSADEPRNLRLARPRHPDSGEFLLPWVFLHAIKDYTDMAAHLERHPHIRCTVNFVPVLLDQIEDYAEQFATGQWRDPLLRIAATPDPTKLRQADRDWLLDMAFRCHAPTMLEPFAHYRRLRDLLTFVRAHDGNGLNYLSGHYLADLATWY